MQFWLNAVLFVQADDVGVATKSGDVGVAKGVATAKSGGESSMKLDWPSESLSSYVPGQIQDSPKMVVLLELICRSVHLGEKMLVFR